MNRFISTYHVGIYFGTHTSRLLPKPQSMASKAFEDEYWYEECIGIEHLHGKTLHMEQRMNRRRCRHLTFHDFPGSFPVAWIFSGNRCVTLTKIIPWDLVDKNYTNGNINGTLILDANCAPAGIHFSSDADIQNDVWEFSENLIDKPCVATATEAKPRNYRQKVWKNWLLLVRNKRSGTILIQKIIKSQLKYLSRNLGQIKVLAIGQASAARQQAWIFVLWEVYRYKKMYVNRRHKVGDRTVSVSQSWVRPIVCGKLMVKAEFGVMLALSLEDGYARIEKLSWAVLNESQTLIESCERYRERNGVYPKRILAGQIFRNRANVSFCKKHGIVMRSPRFDRQSKDKTLYDQQKLLERNEAGERNTIEGKFGEAKRRYGLDRVMARLSETSNTTNHLTILVMNLKKRLRDIFDAIYHWLDRFSSAGSIFKWAVEQ